MGVEADLAELRQPIAPTPITSAELEQLFTTSKLLKAIGVHFEREEQSTWRLTYKSQTYKVTFSPDVYGEQPSLRFMNFGESLFEEFLQSASSNGSMG